MNKKFEIEMMAATGEKVTEIVTHESMCIARAIARNRKHNRHLRFISDECQVVGVS